MQILNSKSEDTPRHSRAKKIRISNMSKNLSERDAAGSPLDPNSRYSMLSENSKAVKTKNEQELSSFYKRLRDGMQREDSEDSGMDSEVTSELLTEDVDTDRRADRMHDDDSGEELSGSIYQKGGSFSQDKSSSYLRRAKTSNLGDKTLQQTSAAGTKKVYQANDRDGESGSRQK